MITYGSYTIHAMQAVAVAGKGLLRTRRITATVSACSAASRPACLVPGTDYLVNG